jgi:hypothetical protein
LNKRRPEAVDELVSQQRLEQVAASPDLQLVTGFLLQRPHCRDDVAGHEASGVRVLAAPRGIGVAEGARHHVLGERVDRRGDGVGGVGLIGPVAAEDVERSATEQERAGVTVELGDELADGGVRERSLPAAVGEPVAGILVGTARGLQHAVEGQERLDGESHVVTDGQSHRF